MKINILIILLFAAKALFATNIDLSMLKKINPEAFTEAKKIEKIKQQINNKKGGDIVYCLISGSISASYMKKVIFEVSSLTPNTHTKLIFVVQGFFSNELIKQYNKLQKQLREYTYQDLFQSNSKIIVDPKLFKKYHIVKVPALMYAKFTKDTYSSSNTIEYLARGDILPLRFFHLISTKDIKFEKYTHIISLLYK